MTRYYDISVPISEQMATWPDDPAVELAPQQRIARGDPANVTRVGLGSHTGTHVDAPRHVLDGAKPVDELPLGTLIGPALVVEIPPGVTAIGETELREAGIEGESRVLLGTRNRELLGSDEFRPDFVHLAEDGADYLLASGVTLVGIDYLSVEAFDADEPLVHRKLLEREVVILEGVDLRGVPPGRYELICLPLRLTGLDGAPARAVLRSIGPG